MAGEWQCLTVAGDGAARGRARGEAHRERIAAILDGWREEFAADAAAAPWGRRLDSFLDDFFQETRFEPAIRRWTPDLLDEVAGMAEASGLPFRTMLAFQLWDEMLVFRMRRRPSGGRDRAGRCSALAADDAPDGVTRIAQNMDLPFGDGEQLLLRIAGADGLETAVLTRATELGLCGMNNAPLGVCCNTLAELDASVSGLPVAFVVRHLLTRTGFDAAVRFLNEVPHASGQNYTVGAPGAIASLECSARSTAAFQPLPGMKRLCHTNHPLANGDRSMAAPFLAHLPPEERSGSPSSHARLAELERRLGDPEVRTDRPFFEEALRFRGDRRSLVSRERSDEQDEFGAFTFWSMICELDPEHPALFVTPGPPSLHRYQRVDLQPMS